MKIAIYDPLYSEIGHFDRYNKYLLQLASSLESISTIWYFDTASGNHNFESISNNVISVSSLKLAVDSQLKLNVKKGLRKFIYLLELMRDYFRLISTIKTYPIDFLLFSSNGTFPFWLVVLFFWKKPYGVSVISLRWLYAGTSIGYVLRTFYTRYLRSARIVFVTEECYRVALLAFGINAIVLPDRFLEKNNAHADEDRQDQYSAIQLVTLGTLSEEKNPISFVHLLKAAAQGVPFNYKIIGKAFGDIGGKLISSIGECLYIEFKDSYLNSGEYDSLMLGSDFVVIPYDQLYTKYMTSGVMWDCFIARKPILCPDVPLFRFYIEKYRIGFIYDSGNLCDILTHYSLHKSQVVMEIQTGYDNLFRDNLFEVNSARFQSAIQLIM